MGIGVEMKFDEKAKISPELYDDSNVYTQSMTWVFNADGTYKYTDRGTNNSGKWTPFIEEGTWKLSGDGKTIEFVSKGNNSKKSQREVIQLIDNSFVMKQVVQSNGVAFTWGEFIETFKKQ